MKVFKDAMVKKFDAIIDEHGGPYQYIKRVLKIEAQTDTDKAASLQLQTDYVNYLTGTLLPITDQEYHMNTQIPSIRHEDESANSLPICTSALF